MAKLPDIRREYKRDTLKREDLSPDPFVQFDRWMQEVMVEKIADPTAMTLATVDGKGQPSQRIVLLKGLDSEGFVFYTNYASEKAADIQGNSQVSLHFPWHWMERQVNVEGRANRVPAEESLGYFSSRPRESQLAAWASAQSRPIESRAELLAQFEKVKEKYQGADVPFPTFWGGYRVVPERFEFWQGGEHRLHDRFEYRLRSDQWVIQRLSP